MNEHNTGSMEVVIRNQLVSRIATPGSVVFDARLFPRRSNASPEQELVINHMHGGNTTEISIWRGPYGVGVSASSNRDGLEASVLFYLKRGLPFLLG